MGLLPLMLLIVLLAGLVGCAPPDNTPERVVPAESQNNETEGYESEPTTSLPAENEEDESDERHFAVGDTIRVGNLEITVVGYRISEGEGFFTPRDDNNVFYLIDVAIANRGDAVESISSMLMFDLRDEDGFSISTSISATAMGRSGIDGAVMPGKVIRGELGYEIPRDSTGFNLQINPQAFGRSGLFSIGMDETSNTPTNPDTLRSSRTGAELQVGETFSSGDLEFVVNGVSMDGGSGFFTPDEGNTFLLIDVSVINNGSESASISSMMMFTLRDSHGFSYSISISAVAAGRGGLDGDVMAGSTLRGELGFEVPDGMTGLELFVSPDIFDRSGITIVSLD